MDELEMNNNLNNTQFKTKYEDMKQKYFDKEKEFNNLVKKIEE